MATAGSEVATLYKSPRPIFTLSMNGLGICFDGFKSSDKEQLKKLYFMIHSMGGRIFSGDGLGSKVTHLVSSIHLENTRTVYPDKSFFSPFQITRHCKGEKYTYASTFDINIMQEAWVLQAWEKRHESGFTANEEKFQNKFKVKPFHGAHIYFMGFSVRISTNNISKAQFHIIIFMKRGKPN